VLFVVVFLFVLMRDELGVMSVGKSLVTKNDFGFEWLCADCGVLNVVRKE